MNNEYLYQKAIDKWGEKSQIMIAIEEAGELITVLAKYGRNINGSTKIDVVNEIADMKIMIEQLELIFDEELVEEAYIVKTMRLEQYLESE